MNHISDKRLIDIITGEIEFTGATGRFSKLHQSCFIIAFNNESNQPLQFQFYSEGEIRQIALQSTQESCK